MIRRPPRSTLFPYTTLSVVAVSLDRKSTRLNSSHTIISYAVFCLKEKRNRERAGGTGGGGSRAAGEGRRAGPRRSPSLGQRCLPRRVRPLGPTTLFIFFFNERPTPETPPFPQPDPLPI